MTDAKSRSPYAPSGDPFFAVSHKALEYLLTLNGAEKDVAIAWMIKWDRDTCGGQYTRPVAFTWRDVESRGVCSRRTFKTARARLEGILFRRAKTGKGYANQYFACFKPRAERPNLVDAGRAMEIPGGAAHCTSGGAARCTTHESAGDPGVSWGDLRVSSSLNEKDNPNHSGRDLRGPAGFFQEKATLAQTPAEVARLALDCLGPAARGGGTLTLTVVIEQFEGLGAAKAALVCALEDLNVLRGQTSLVDALSELATSEWAAP